MPGPHDGEMPVIESRELRFFQTLDNRQNSSVDKPKREVAIAVQKLSNPSIVTGFEVDDSQDSGVNVGEEIEERIRMKSLTS